jgi:protein-S-isoprenylcysteine O-methyltransferase Ste14
MSKSAFSISMQAIIGLIALAVVLWVVLFFPAGSLDYWQAWVYWFVFFACVSVVSFYFLKKDLNLIASRLKAGPGAEKETNQKITQAFASIFFVLLLLVPSVDHHFHWSNVPACLSIVGDVFVALGLLIVFLVFKENSFTSAIIEVNKNQEVISTGPYSVVRHPMYSGALLMLLFTPIALGSFWGLFIFPPMLIVIAYRLVEEEKFLTKNLIGYEEFRKKTRDRLIPHIW